MTDSRRFRFTAIDKRGLAVTGSRVGATRGAIVAGLVHEGLYATRVSPAWRLRQLQRASRADAFQGLNALAMLLEAGLNLGRALAALDSLAPPSWNHALPELRGRVRRGETLAAALTGSGIALPAVVIELVRAGELAGDLPSGVRTAARHAEERQAQRVALISTLTYPTLLAAVALASMAILVGVVIPRFAVILSDMGAALPSSTRFLVAVSTRLRGVAPFAGISFVALCIAVAMCRRSTRYRTWLDGMVLRLPVAGSLLLQLSSSRFAAATAALLRRGAPIYETLGHAARTSGNLAIMARTLRAREGVLRGNRLSDALASTRSVTDLAIRFVRTGEEVGEVARMLEEAARVEAERARGTINRMTRLLEPGIILLFGGLVAFIAAALLQAVYAIRVGT